MHKLLFFKRRKWLNPIEIFFRFWLVFISTKNPDTSRYDTYIFIHSFFQVIANTLLLLSANLIGYYYQFMSSKSQKRTFEQIRSTVESRVKLECEKEHQEQLLLSVIPAYIAAEVCTLSVYFIVPRLNNLLQLPWPGFFTITILSLGKKKYHA